MAAKHRQLARQVGDFIKIDPANSMATFSFDCTMLNQGTTFVFGSWVCIANGSCRFNSHLADAREPEASASASRSNIDELAADLDAIKIFDLIGNHES